MLQNNLSEHHQLHCYSAQHPCWVASWPVLLMQGRDGSSAWVFFIFIFFPRMRGSIYREKNKNNEERGSPFSRLCSAVELAIPDGLWFETAAAWLWPHLVRTRTRFGSHYTTMDSCSSPLAPPTSCPRGDPTCASPTGWWRGGARPAAPGS